MLLEDIACQVLINSGKFNTKEIALEHLKSEYRTHFPFDSYEQWNKDLPQSISQNIISNVGKNGSMSIRFLIKDLETICKQL